MRHAVLSRLCLLLAATALCAACSSVRNGYRQDPMALASPEVAPQDDKQLYVELISKMQQQGAYYASLAHVEAYRQRYGDSPQLRLLNADALRETGQRDAALAMYGSLTSSPQAAAAWHGIGLIAARDGDAVRAEQSLAKAVQLQPLNTGYLGDLGFARLRAGDWARAQEPLAKAAELSPGSAKANANLAVWALLRGQNEMAETIMRNARLTDSAQAEVRRLAEQLRQQASPAPSVQRAPASVAAATAAPGADTDTAPAPHAAASSPAPRRVAADTDRRARTDARLAPSMLERFSTPTPASETTP
jgi:Flp pilus assembly protein TadD